METTEVEAGVLGLMPLLEFVLIDFAVSEMWTVAFWSALWKIIVANIVLSGDNAVVIAMASRNLSDKYRRRAIFLGSAGAVVLRILFCAVIGLLLGVPYLKLVGGALLLWIGVKLMAEEEGEADIKAHENLWAAIWHHRRGRRGDEPRQCHCHGRGGARRHDDDRLRPACISVPVIMLGATVIASVLDRYPWVALVGAGLIGWIAGDVIAGDGRFDEPGPGGKLVEVVRPGSTAAWLDATIPHAELVFPALGAAVVLVVGLYLVRRRAAKAPAD